MGLSWEVGDVRCILGEGGSSGVFLTMGDTGCVLGGRDMPQAPLVETHTQVCAITEQGGQGLSGSELDLAFESQ